MSDRILPLPQPARSGALLEAALRLFRRSLPSCLPLSLAAVLMGQLPSAWDLLQGRPATLQSPKDATWWLLAVGGGLVNLLVWNAILLRQRALATGVAVPAATLLRAAAARLPDALALMLASTALVLLGGVLFVLPGLYLLVALWPAWPRLLEGPGVVRALDDALQLSRGHVLQGAALALAALLGVLASYAAGYLGGLVLAQVAGAGGPETVRRVGAVVAALAGALFLPFLAALTLARHADLEQRRALRTPRPAAPPGAPGAAAR